MSFLDSPVQKYPVLRILIPFIVGLLLGDSLHYLHVPHLSNVGLVMMGVMAIVLVILYNRERHPVPWKFGLISSLFFLFFGLWSISHKHSSLFTEWSGEGDSYVALVESAPKEKPRSYALQLSITGCDNSGVDLQGQKILLYLPKDSSVYSLTRGDTIAFYADLNIPQNLPTATFDYSRWLYRRDIVATDYTARWKFVSHGRDESFPARFTSMREKLLNRYLASGLDSSTVSVLAALTLGDKSLVNESLRNDYSVSGVAHVLALSGFHLSIVYFVLSFLFGADERRLSRRRVVQLPIIVLIWLFTLFVGCPVSLVRASVMCTMMSAGILIGQGSSPLNSLSLAAFLMLLVNPFLLFDVGFQLSFASVVSILLFHAPLNRLLRTHNWILRKVWSVMCVSFVAQIGVAPLLLHYFGHVSLYFLLSNMVVSVLVTIVMAFSVVFIVSLFLPFMSEFAHWSITCLVAFMNHVVSVIASLPCSTLLSARISSTSVVLAYLAIAFFAYAFMRKRAKRVIAFQMSFLSIVAILIIEMCL